MITNDFFIRDYISADYEGVISLWALTGLGGAHRGDNAEIIDKTLSSGGKMLLLVEKNTGRIIGTSWLTNDFRRVYLHHFGIHPDFQGRGLASPLVEESIAFAKELGLQIKLEVHRDNHKAIALYKKFGFQYLGDYMVYIIRNFS